MCLILLGGRGEERGEASLDNVVLNMVPNVLNVFPKLSSLAQYSIEGQAF